jgi:hypothetical protein
MPVYFHISSPGEPNNACGQAHNIAPIVTYQFYPNDAVDWYKFELDSSGSLSIRLTNFLPVAGQVAVYRGQSCDNLQFLGSNGDFTTFKEVILGVQPAGKYFVFVSNDGNFSNSSSYTLQARFFPN